MRGLSAFPRGLTRSLSWLAPTLLLAAPLAACGDDESTDSPDHTDGSDIPSTDGSTDGDAWAAPTETNNWQVFNLERGRLSHNQYILDFYRLNSDGSERTASAEFPGLADAGLTCERGCSISPDGRYLAVTVSSDLTGSSIQVGTLGPDQRFTAIPGAQFSQVADFKMGGDFAYFTSAAGCTSDCTYTFTRAPLVGGGQPQALGQFPITTQTQSLYRGAFRLSANGKTAIALTPTIHSTRLNFWQDGKGFSESADICRLSDEAGCTGAGSEYNEHDPLTIDASGRYVAFFTTTGAQQIIRAYDLTAGRHWDTLVVNVNATTYSAGVCTPGQLQPWQWPKVVGTPAFNADASEVFFMAEETCPVNGSIPTKTKIDIMRIKTATLLNDAPLLEDEVFNVTQLPAGDVVDNLRPTALAVSPDSATLVFVGTSSQDSSGAPLGDSSSRSRSDRELYRIRVDGENLNLLYNDNEYSADLPVIIAR